MKKIYLPFILLILACSFMLLSVPLFPIPENNQDGEDSWPRKFETDHVKIVVYQPQPDSLEGNILKGRAAFSMTTEMQKEPVFGAMWFEATVDIDRDKRTVEILTMKIPQVRITEAESEQGKKLAGTLQEELSGLNITMSYDHLLASINASEQERKTAVNLKNSPPRILVEYEPAVLVVIAGEPELRKLGDTGLLKVINTPFFIVLDPKTKLYWLSGASIWFSASEIKGKWNAGETPPATVSSAFRTDLESRGVDPQGIHPPEDKRIPKIIVATEPSELIVIDGEPILKALPGNELLYVKNTEDDIFIELDSESYFIVLGGRWYQGKDLEGPWEYVRPDKLPKSFAAIPPNSEKGHVLTFVPGTCMAKHAVADAQVPQTAAIKRNETALTVTYDGEPQFRRIGDTSMEYAVNTGEQVLRIDGRYYCCHQAVWFDSDSPVGPWSVCANVPNEVQSIPADNPCYNTKYVRVYDSSPDYVYTGYTPGYLGSYPYYGSVVYGTGYCYSPWFGIGPICYPQFWTWGCHSNFNPWTGWCFGMSWSPSCSNFFNTFNHCNRWWGSCGSAWRRNNNFLNHPVIVNRAATASNISSGMIHENIFNHLDSATSIRTSARMSQQTRNDAGKAVNRLQTTPARNMSNDVLSDRQGNVFKKSAEGWEYRSSGKWQPADIRPAQNVQRSEAVRQVRVDSRIPASVESSQRISSAITPQTFSNLNTEFQSRERGATMQRSYNASSGSIHAGTGGGGAAGHGGGGGGHGGGGHSSGGGGGRSGR